MPPEGEGGNSSFFIMLGLIFLVMYFFMIRPQARKQKKQENFRKGISKGDKIVTIGGIHCKVTEAMEDRSAITVQTDGGHKFRLERGAISQEYTDAAYASDEKKT